MCDDLRFCAFLAFFCFVFLKGGDKLTLALGSNNNKNISGSPTSPHTSTGLGGGPGSPPMDKLINLDSPTSNTSAGAPLLPLRAEGPGATGPPLPPPRTTSDPSYNINKIQKTTTENNTHNSSTNTKNISNEDLLTNENNNDSTNLSVTYFSSGLNGHGIERETIFTDDRRPSVSASLSKDAASIVRQHLVGVSGSNPFTTNYHHSNSSTTTTPSKNPFLLDHHPISSSSTTANNTGEKNNSETLDDIVEKKIQDLINANPFNNGTSGTTGNGSGKTGSGGGSGGNGGKFNTIGRSNPFSSPNTSKNPFLDQKSGFTDQKSGGLTDQKITSSGEDVNDSPDSSLEPEDHHNGLLHETPSINKIVSTHITSQ